MWLTLSSYASTMPVVLTVRDASTGEGISLTCVRSVVRLLGYRPYLCQVGRTTAGDLALPVAGRPHDHWHPHTCVRPAYRVGSATSAGQLSEGAMMWRPGHYIEDNAEVGKVSSEEERSFFEEKLSEVRLVIYFTKSLVTWCFAFVLPSEEVYQKVTKLQDKVATVNRIPKPKPKIEKPPKEEPVSQENSTGTSNNTSGEPTSETGQTTQDSVDSSHTGTDQERAVHDEL
ncbi:hypothetical protein GW17_00060825 [Ensete ventricosum]|nr:hypothetical protein GW17_00060825 [Ensete ventricosum]